MRMTKVTHFVTHYRKLFHDLRNSGKEHMPSKLWVTGSNPAVVAKIYIKIICL